MFQIHGFVFLMSIKHEIFTVHNTCCQDIVKTPEKGKIETQNQKNS
jgi:hypothetical protein